MNKTRKKLMSDHVKERAIGFAEWLQENHWLRDRTNMWYQYAGKTDNPQPQDIETLYEQYLDIVFKQLST